MKLNHVNERCPGCSGSSYDLDVSAVMCGDAMRNISVVWLLYRYKSPNPNSIPSLVPNSKKYPIPQLITRARGCWLTTFINRRQVQNKMFSRIKINIDISCLSKLEDILHWKYFITLSSTYTIHSLISPLVPHICVSKLGQHWFRQWLVACSAPSHCLDQCWLIVNWTLRNKRYWNSIRNTKGFFHEKHLKMSSAKWWPFCPGRDELSCPPRQQRS